MALYILCAADPVPVRCPKVCQIGETRSSRTLYCTVTLPATNAYFENSTACVIDGMTSVTLALDSLTFLPTLQRNNTENSKQIFPEKNGTITVPMSDL
jgi:hypothetical protein